MTRSTFFLVLALGLILACSVSASPHRIGFSDDTTILIGDGEFCPGSTELQNDDGSMESAYAWSLGGVAPPDYGAWAECYDALFVCGIRFLFTDLYYFSGQDMTVFVWDDDENAPGNVLCLVAGIVPDPPAIWPNISTHDVQVCCATGGGHFVGFWGNWPGANHGWFIAADEDGPGDGCPLTKVAPDTGFPTGWQPPPGGFFQCKDLGIREYAGQGDCMPTPAAGVTWGRIKALF